jgi:hypothetical protein
MLEVSFYIRTGQENTSCPNGIGERDMGWIVRGSVAGGQLLHQDRTENTSSLNGIDESGTWAGW